MSNFTVEMNMFIAKKKKPKPVSNLLFKFY